MKRKKLWIISLLLCGLTVIYFSFFRSDIETSTKIKNNNGNSISYLSEENDQSVLKVFNFNQERVTKKLKIKQEKDIYSTSYYNPVENKTLVITQQIEPYGYQVYLQDQFKFQKLGLLKERVQEVVFNNNYIYALVYSNGATFSAELKKFKFNQLEKPLKTWKIEGAPEKLLLNIESDEIYILARTNKTLLYSLKKNEQIVSKEIFDQGYDLNAYFEEGDLWILAREILINTNEKSKRNKKIESLYIIDPTNGALKKEIHTKNQPKFIQMDENRIYVITGTSNSSFLEIFDNETFQSEKVLKIEAEAIYGFISVSNGEYIFTNRGIIKIQQKNLKNIVEDKVSPYTDLIIN